MTENREGKRKNDGRGRVLTIENFFNMNERTVIKRTIKQAEKTTTGEIKVVVVQSSKLYGTVDDRAVVEFYEEGLDGTEAHTGFLIMISLDERQIAVYAGRAINKKLSQDSLNGIVQTIATGITLGQPVQGIVDGIGLAESVLAEYFPAGEDNKNEISNEIVLKQ